MLVRESDELLLVSDELLFASDELLLASDELLFVSDELLLTITDALLWASDELLLGRASLLFASDELLFGRASLLFASEELDLSRRLKALARKKGKTIVILTRHPLLTSARKLHLYTAREHLWFLAKTILGGGRTLNSREACHTWYDGRR